ncbi:MAG: hypothetical protein Q7S65_02540 [Nanoarchaeota archaeon]|nr:hypothetical protein [Nanoarchaeota archaeon]
MKILLVACNKCGKAQKYQAKTLILGEKRKQCVYCGKSFLLRESVVSR